MAPANNNEAETLPMPTPPIKVDSAKAMMVRGSKELHELVASRVETALGQRLPQMEVRFKNVAISADITVKNKKQAKMELPTLANTLKMAARQVSMKKHVVKKQVLYDMSGVFKPGTITLVLGQPGSGKSSLMKLLSGRFPSSRNVTVEGEMTYNGTPREDIIKRLPQLVSYVGQHDKHYPTLTVKETLEFAHACNGGNLSKRDEAHLVNGTAEENEAALEVARALYKHHPEVVIQQLGLDNCQNTIVGNAMVRGVSGGERKRVTTGEMEFGNKLVMMMDEISTGLDSAATFDIISTQRSLAKRLHKTVVISLLQPSPEVFALFDDVVLLNKGRMVYHGPREQVLGYFESLGFSCPPQRDVADFLLDLGTNKQQQYEVGSVPRTAREFADIFDRSPIHERMLREVDSSVEPALLADTKAFVDPVSQFRQVFLGNTVTLARRELMVLTRNTSVIKSRVFMAVVLGLFYGSTFYQIDRADSQLIIGVAFQVTNVFSMVQSTLIPALMAVRDVQYKQRGANFFRMASYVLASSVSHFAMALLETLIFGTIVYWMCGFVTTAAGYLLFELVMLLLHMAFAAWFFLIASISPDLNVAGPVSMVSLLFFTTFSGFVVTMENIPDYLIWVYWISPLGWAVHALVVNQYTDASFDVCVDAGVNYCEKYGMSMGEYAMSIYDVPTGRFWLWYGIIFLVVVYIFFMGLSCLVLEYWRYESPGNVALDEEENEGDGSPIPSASDEYGLMKTPKNVPSLRKDGMNHVEVEVSAVHQTHSSFVPVTVAFKNLWYSVPDPTQPKATIDLLKGISGFALPGTITALMGSSGAGKTTLMDVIAGRKTGGKVRGDILLNGHPATDLAIRRATGYCEQMDIHSEASTFREALTFSAFLRQGASGPGSAKYDSVDECLELLGLAPIADQIIRGSSMEQMKRLTIGVELAAQPSVLFLDEPTSGLDARSAKLIMDGVRKVADTGRTVVCTIHQPSAAVFQVFDSLLLLKRGGETVFFGDLGDKASNLVHYFEAIEGVAPLEKEYNPATWMLEVIGAGVGNNNADKTDFVELFKASGHFQQLQQNLDQEGVGRPSPSVAALSFGDKRAASNWTQARFLIKRFFDLYWRTATYNLTRSFVFTVVGVMFGITFIGAEYTSYQGINSGMGAMYMTTAYISFITFNGVLPITFKERTSFYRERAAQTYSAFWYFIGATLVEIPYCFLLTMIFVVFFYPMLGFTGVSQFFAYWFNLSLLILMQAYFGQLIAYVMPTLQMASIFVVLIGYLCNLFTGFNPPADSIPRGYRWIYRIMPHKFTYASLTAIALGDCPADGDGSEIGCQQMTGIPPSLEDGITVKGYLESMFWVKHSEIWFNCAIVVVWIVGFRLLGLLALRFVNHQKR